MKLSYSSITLYDFCSEKYRLQRIEKIPEKEFGSALHFGTAIDAALGRVLLTKKQTLTAEEQKDLGTTPMQHFLVAFRDFNGVTAYETATLSYSFGDAQTHVLQDDDFRDIAEYALRHGIELDSSEIVDRFLEETKKLRKDGVLDTATRFTFGYIAWKCLYRKAELMLQVYEQEILPQIDYVVGTQISVEIINDFGDNLVGYIDAVVRFKGDAQDTVVDNKTSSKAYSEASVKDSLQLAVYCEKMNLRQAAYAVLDKNMRKNYPMARFQLVKDIFSEEDLDRHFSKVDSTLNNIKEQRFYMKATKKECFQFGQKCGYFDICWK